MNPRYSSSPLTMPSHQTSSNLCLSRSRLAALRWRSPSAIKCRTFWHDSQKADTGSSAPYGDDRHGAFRVSRVRADMAMASSHIIERTVRQCLKAGVDMSFRTRTNTRAITATISEGFSSISAEAHSVHPDVCRP